VTSLLVVKTAALGDVLRTTSILPGLARASGAAVTWVTAHGALDLVRTHPLIDTVVGIDPSAPTAGPGGEALRRLATRGWDRILSFDDEEPLCRWVAELARASGARVSGATLDAEGRRVYTSDVAPWFDMGLLSVHGKEHADRLKVQNRRTHPEIFATMLGIEPGRPQLVLCDSARTFGNAFFAGHGLDRARAAGRRIIGLNTGAGGRWISKQLPVERTIELARRLSNELEGAVVFLVFGGPAEAERNARIVAGLAADPAAVLAVDAGCDNALLDFAALVAGCDLLVTSDSLALHLAIAQEVPITAFFAPTSAAEIEIYGLGEKVVSTAPDYCSYRPDADNTTITAERLAAACLRVMAASGAADPDLPAWGR